MLATFSRRGILGFSRQVRYASTKREASAATALQSSAHAVAKELAATNVWAKTQASGKSRPKVEIQGDGSRVNIVSKQLCNDIEQYLGPSLQRHVGCDLVDLFPGAGVWSRKLHAILQPRSHTLMEPDATLYRPFLKDLLKKPATKIVPTSGLVWTELDKVLASLPHQKPMAPDASVPPRRNDTLLVTANLSSFPRTRATARATTLHLYQLVSAIRSGTLFQKYGLVRMLIWVRPEDLRSSILPSTVQLRSRSAVEAELSCEWVHEVAGLDILDKTVQDSTYTSRRLGSPRDEWIERVSAQKTLQRLQQQGLVIPRGRRTKMAKDIQAGEGKTPKPSKASPSRATYAAELQALEEELDAGKLATDSREYKRLVRLRYRATSDMKKDSKFATLLDEYSSMVDVRRQGSDTTELERAWNAEVSKLNYAYLSTFRLLRDNLHLFYQNPPVMHWDRRTLEPLLVKASDFFPGVGCSLVDIQPKVAHPLLRGSSTDTRLFDLIASVLLRNSTEPIDRQLDVLWPDASQSLLPGCPSLRDPDKGGAVGTSHAGLCARTLNESHWVEILEAWKKWPFRPTLERLEHHHSELETDTDEEGSSGGEGDFFL